MLQRVVEVQQAFDAGARAYESGQFEAAIQAFDQAYAISPREGLLFSLAQAHRNCELTEQLGDVFSRAVALTGLGQIQTMAGEHAAALESLELAERIHHEAMGAGGEQECWRGTLKVWALLGLGRDEEALAQAERMVAIAREREMNWQLPSALLSLAQARRANCSDGVEEALDEATEICNRLGHTQTLGKVEAERAAPATA